MSLTDIVAVKAFGDLVIARTAIALAPPSARSNLRLLIGSHLVPLIEAIGSPVDYRVIQHGEPGVPACFDARKAGAWRALKSLHGLRRAIRATAPQHLLFDRLTRRERILAGGVRASALPEAENIYLAYRAALGGDDDAHGMGPGGDEIGIFPGSRMAHKNLPEALVRQVIAAVEAHGMKPHLLLLEGERPDLEASGLPHNVVPRSFEAMNEATARCARVISADSMPAHMAEMNRVPIHVLTPVDNRYWMPWSSFRRQRWSLFDADIDARIGAFLAE